MSAPKFSIVIPARDEERFIGPCLESIRIAGANYAGQVEVIVVLNRCSDGTEAIAQAAGARIVREDARNLSRIRNQGARAASGEVLVTIDADSRMSPGTLAAIDRALASGKTVGGGATIRADGRSPGIQMTLALLRILLLVFRFSGGMFWCRREDFAAIGGFDEGLVSAEDVDFALRLKAHGRRVRRPFTTLKGAHIVTSSRKFDEFGDWCVVTHLNLFWKLARGRNQRAADYFFYNFRR